MSKKLIVPKEQFPGMSIYDPNYEVRFRIVSDDRNRVSAWSPIYSVNPEVVFIAGTQEIPGQIHLQKSGDTVMATWDSVTIYKDIDGSLSSVAELPYYDLWIKWAGNGGATPSNWTFKESVFSTSININIPNTYPDPNPPYGNITPKQLYIELYRPGRPISRYQETKSFAQNAATINITDNTFILANGHGYTTGNSITYASTTPVSPLTNGGTYYIRAINYTIFALYPTSADAIADTNRVNLTGALSGTGSITGYPFRLYSGSITTL